MAHNIYGDLAAGKNLPKHTAVIGGPLNRAHVSMRKAADILRHGKIRGRNLTKRQQGLFGAIRGGTRPTRLKRRG